MSSNPDSSLRDNTNAVAPRALSLRCIGARLGSLSWPTVCALLLGWILLMAVLIVNDSALEGLGAPGVFALQGAGSMAEFRDIVAAWSERGAPALLRVGFSLGWDFVLIIAYTLAFVAAGLRTRRDLFPAHGAARRISLIAVMLLPVGGLLDGIENVLQLLLVLGEGSEALAGAATTVTSVKWVLVTPCMALAFVGLVAAAFRGVTARK